MYLHACGKEKDVASELTNSPMTSDNDSEVAPTARIMFSLKKTHLTLPPPSKAE